MPGDFHPEFLLLSEQISNHRWRWNANLDGQHPWTMGNDLSLLGIHMHFTLGTPHLVDTCLIVWAGAHVGSTISSIAKIVEYRGFTGTSLERFRIEDGCDHPFKRIVLTQSTGKAIFVLTQIPGERLEIGMAKQLGDVGEGESIAP